MKSRIVQASQGTTVGGTSFLISIYHQENQSWQGAIQWLDTGQKTHFRSELELLNLIHNAVQENGHGEEPLRTWKDPQKQMACV